MPSALPVFSACLRPSPALRNCALRHSRGVLARAAAGKRRQGHSRPHWLGLGVKGYFRVTLGKSGQEPDFYTFDSRIRAAATGPAGRARLRLDEPEGVVFGQRRKSLRVQPECDRLRKVFYGATTTRKDSPSTPRPSRAAISNPGWPG